MGRPIEVPDDAVIKAGEALLAEGKAVSATSLWSNLRKRGRPDRIITVWNEHARASAAAPHEPSSLSALPEPAARLLSGCKAQLGAGMDACVLEIYAIVERTIVGRFQAELAATATSRTAHKTELQEALQALGDLADEHDAALLQVQNRERDVVIAQTTLKAERDFFARVELEHSALSARIDSLTTDLSTAAGLVQAAGAGRSRAEILVQTGQTELDAANAALDGMRDANLKFELEVGAARRACQLYESQIERQAGEIKELRGELTAAGARHIEQATRAAGAERALEALQRSMASSAGRRTPTYNTRGSFGRRAGLSQTDETYSPVGTETIDDVTPGPRP